MPLLGGATKLSGGGVPSGNPAFTSKPYQVDDIALPPLDAAASVELRGNGQVWELRRQFGDQQIGRWDNNLGTLTISDFDFRMDTVTGTLNRPGTQAADTWINGFSNMFWGVREFGIGVEFFEGNLRVRPAGGGSDFDIVGVELRAEATP